VPEQTLRQRLAPTSKLVRAAVRLVGGGDIVDSLDELRAPAAKGLLDFSRRASLLLSDHAQGEYLRVPHGDKESAEILLEQVLEEIPESEAFVAALRGRDRLHRALRARSERRRNSLGSAGALEYFDGMLLHLCAFVHDWVLESDLQGRVERAGLAALLSGEEQTHLKLDQLLGVMKSIVASERVKDVEASAYQARLNENLAGLWERSHRFAEEVEGRYGAGRAIIYTRTPAGVVSARTQAFYRAHRDLLQADSTPDLPTLLLRYSQRLQRRVEAAEDLGHYGTYPGSYWLVELRVHADRCRLRSSFSSLQSFDQEALRLILRGSADGQERSQSLVDRFLYARRAVLSVDSAVHEWVRRDFGAWLEECDGDPLPEELRSWVDELREVSDLLSHLAAILHAVGPPRQLTDTPSVRTVYLSPSGAPSSMGDDWVVLDGGFLPTETTGGAVLKRAGVALERGDHPKARELALSALREGVSEALVLLGMADFERGDRHSAETWWIEATSAGQPSASYFLGKLAYKDGDIEEAVDLLTAAANAQLPQAYPALAQIALEAGDVAGHRAWTQRGARLGDAFCQHNAARAAFARSDWKEAYYWLEGIVESHDGTDHRAKFLEMYPETRKAVVSAPRVWRDIASEPTGPVSSSVWIATTYMLGEMWEERRDFDKARMWFLRAAEAGAPMGQLKAAALSHIGRPHESDSLGDG
jgi:TPR repeat protein